MSTKKPIKSQIEQKDLADDVSKILGDEFDNAKTKLLNIGFDYLLDGNINDIKEWSKKQQESFGAFKLQVDNLVKSEKKTLLKTVVNGSKLIGLNSEQVKKLKKEVNKGVSKLGSAVISTQVMNINKVNSQVFKVNAAESLYKTISDVITKTNDYGIVTYSNGRKVRWENHMEMRVRTEIQNDIADNMINTGNEYGVVFYIATYHGDCAPDHANFQGKIYCAKNWKSICPKEYLDEVAKYIKTHKIMNVEDVIGPKGNYFTKRPNCRHYLQYISIQEVLQVKNDKDLNNLRESYDLNSAGKYKPEKYEALKQQRYNERSIRKTKSDILIHEKIIAELPDDTPIGVKSKYESELKFMKKNLKLKQKHQRELLNSNKGVLQRNYNREAYSRMISDMGVETELKALKKHQIDGTIKEKYEALVEEAKNEIVEYRRVSKIVEQRFNDGTYKKEIAPAQRKHIEGTKEYNDAVSSGKNKSILTADPEKLLKSIGKGTYIEKPDGQIFETIIFKEKIGIYTTKGKESVETNIVSVRYSKHGIHFIPVDPKKGMKNK